MVLAVPPQTAPELVQPFPNFDLRATHVLTSISFSRVTFTAYAAEHD